MPNYKLTIEYDGSAYSGWQIQENAPTVQETVKNALEMILRHPVALQGASRTDAGVHARGQVANFESETPVDEFKLLRSLCALCAPHIAVTKVEEVPSSFNARFSAKGKHYRYKVLNRRAHSPLRQLDAWHVAAPLDVEKMRRAAHQLEGTHDFAGFRSSDCGRDNTVRTITSVTILPSDDMLELHVKGTAFLKNMVRIIAGTLVDIGRGVLKESVISELFDTCDRTRAGRTAPAHGLTLMEVYYESGAPEAEWVLTKSPTRAEN